MSSVFAQLRTTNRKENIIAEVLVFAVVRVVMVVVV